MMDRSITYGGSLPEARSDERQLLADVLDTLKREAERRGWTGARIAAVRRIGCYRQIEIVPDDEWSMSGEALEAMGAKRRRDGG